ncbi:hypothetical protein evm_003285 [Chilo suppressalis]|nr:hypothetical protein evm_003285 [Chilo suppressalis]
MNFKDPIERVGVAPSQGSNYYTAPIALDRVANSCCITRSQELAKSDPATLSTHSKIYFCKDHFDANQRVQLS